MEHDEQIKFYYNAIENSIQYTLHTTVTKLSEI